MKRYQYRSYREYVEAQKRGFEKKRNRVWANRENVEAISRVIGPCETGICHGVRGGQEVGWFREFTGGQVIGTEIGESEAPHTVRWDFNERHPPWVGEFDFVYSNAFDHSFDPARTLAVWWEQLRPGGRLIIETDERNEHTGKVSKGVNATDPTGLTLGELVALVEEVTKEAPEIVELPFVTYRYRNAILARKGGLDG